MSTATADAKTRRVIAAGSLWWLAALTAFIGITRRRRLLRGVRGALRVGGGLATARPGRAAVHGLDPRGAAAVILPVAALAAVRRWNALTGWSRDRAAWERRAAAWLDDLDAKGQVVAKDIDLVAHSTPPSRRRSAEPSHA
jgi:hypothetical protein